MKLLLGGGAVTKKGFVNVDILALPSVDIVADITKGLPLEDNSVEEIIGDYFLTNLHEIMFVMEEIYRVCKDGAIVRFKIPWHQSVALYKDPTHQRAIPPETFESFDQRNRARGLLLYGQTSNFHMEQLTYNYYKRGMKYIPFIGILRKYLWNIVKSYVIVLRVVKD